MQRQSLTMRAWCDIVQTYTSCQLTKRGDKLAAIAGLAQAVQKSLKGSKKYIAGMWELDLYRQLSWRTVDTGTRETSITAPSWSWASVNAVIKGYFHGDREHTYFGNTAQIGSVQSEDPARVNVKVQYLSPVDEFGSVTSGILRLRCEYLYHGKVKPFESKYNQIRYNFECLNDSQIATRTLDIQWDIKGFCQEDNTIGAPVHLFPLKTLTTRGKHDSSAQGLVLTPRNERGQYERVGYYEVDDWYATIHDFSFLFQYKTTQMHPPVYVEEIVSEHVYADL
jgi:hypothetical protein